MEKRLLIAIDGPSASGKGTISKLLSEKFNIPHLNTGGLYRGVAYKAHQQNVNLDDEKAVIEVAKTLNEEAEEAAFLIRLLTKVPFLDPVFPKAVMADF